MERALQQKTLVMPMSLRIVALIAYLSVILDFMLVVGAFLFFPDVKDSSSLNPMTLQRYLVGLPILMTFLHLSIGYGLGERKAWTFWAMLVYLVLAAAFSTSLCLLFADVVRLQKSVFVMANWGMFAFWVAVTLYVQRERDALTE